MFNIYDSVEIFEKIEDGIYWSDEMDITIGMIGKIDDISPTGLIRVYFDDPDYNDFWWYHPDSLRASE